MILDGDKVVEMCRIGQGASCCAFVVVGEGGFECAKGSKFKSIIDQRLAAGTINAKGIGGWEGCAWKEVGGK